MATRARRRDGLGRVAEMRRRREPRREAHPSVRPTGTDFADAVKAHRIVDAMSSSAQDASIEWRGLS